MQVNLNAGVGPASAMSPQDLKLRRAAQEFEGELLSCLLGPLAEAFSSPSGNGPSAGSDQYGYLGIQALGAALSRSGGIGIGRLVLGQIGKHVGEGRGQERPGPDASVRS
jgi:Rod binding domain-containing protein